MSPDDARSAVYARLEAASPFGALTFNLDELPWPDGPRVIFLPDDLGTVPDVPLWASAAVQHDRRVRIGLATPNFRVTAELTITLRSRLGRGAFAPNTAGGALLRTFSGRGRDGLDFSRGAIYRELELEPDDRWRRFLVIAPFAYYD